MRRINREQARLSVDLPPELKAEITRFCNSRNIALRDFVIQALSHQLKKYEVK